MRKGFNSGQRQPSELSFVVRHECQAIEDMCLMAMGRSEEVKHALLKKLKTIKKLVRFIQESGDRQWANRVRSGYEEVACLAIDLVSPETDTKDRWIFVECFAEGCDVLWCCSCALGGCPSGLFRVVAADVGGEKV